MSKVQKTWRLPRPDYIDGKKTWYPVVRVGRVVPFGYKQDPNDDDVLLPIPSELELYEQAKKHLKKYSYRDVANWTLNISLWLVSSELHSTCWCGQHSGSFP